MNRLQTVLTTALAIALTATLAGPAAAAPQSISFTGNLSDDAGPTTGSVSLTARVYDDNNQLIWEEKHPSVQAQAGLVFVELGSVDRENNGLDTTVFDGDARFLEIEVDGDVLSPRLALLSVPYATHAQFADKTNEAAFAKDAEFAESAGTAEKLGTLSASDFSRSSHDHDADYATKSHEHPQYAPTSHPHPELLPRGTTLACTGTNKMVGINNAGNVVCASDLNTSSSYSAGAGLSLNSSNQFSLSASGVTSSHIANGTITGADIATGAITSADIANSTITSADIANGTITGTDIATGTITTSDIATNGVEGVDIKDGTVTNSDIATGTLTRSRVNGAVHIYEINDVGCSNYKMMTTSTTCKTRFNGVTYFNCNGTLGTTQKTCSNGSLGYMFKP